MANGVGPQTRLKLPKIAKAARSKRSLRLLFYLILFLSDVLSLTAGFVIGQAIDEARGQPSDSITMPVSIALIYTVFGMQTFNANVLEHWQDAARRACMRMLMAFLLALAIAMMLKESLPVLRLGAMVTVLSATTLLFLCRGMIGLWSRHLFRGSALSRMLIIDSVNTPVPAGLRIASGELIELPESRMHPVALDRFARQLTGVDEVFIACPPDRRRSWSAVFKGSSVRARMLIPELNTSGFVGNRHFAGVATVLVSGGGMQLRDRILKRSFDLALVIPTLVVLTPFLVLIALAIKVSSGGPILFVQNRIGEGNHLFSMFKFRSMQHATADTAGELSTARDDPRLTRIGKLIRGTSIDELPQLFNILRGDMSFVGPRPHAIGSLAGDQLFWEADRRYPHRHACKPGLTGLAQVRGLRGATHRREDLVNRLESDLEYVSGWSLTRDVTILLATLKVVVHRNAF